MIYGVTSEVPFRDCRRLQWTTEECLRDRTRLILQYLNLLFHLREGLVAGLGEVDVFIALVLDNVVKGGELLESVVCVVALLRQVCYHKPFHLHLSANKLPFRRVIFRFVDFGFTFFRFLLFFVFMVLYRFRFSVLSFIGDSVSVVSCESRLTPVMESEKRFTL